MANRQASIVAQCAAASPMPTTGARARQRAASSPVSSKQAITWASTHVASACSIRRSIHGTASAPSTGPSIDCGPPSAPVVMIAAPGGAAASPAAAMPAVMLSLALGLTTWIRIRAAACAAAASG